MYVLKSPRENYEGGVEAPRVESFETNMLSPWEIVLLMQDIMEAGLLHVLPQKYLFLCTYYVEIGLLTIDKRARH